MKECAERVNAYTYMSCNRRCDGLLAVVTMLCDPRDPAEGLTRDQMRSYCCMEKTQRPGMFDDYVRRFAMEGAPKPDRVEA